MPSSGSLIPPSLRTRRAEIGASGGGALSARGFPQIPQNASPSSNREPQPHAIIWVTYSSVVTDTPSRDRREWRGRAERTRVPANSAERVSLLEQGTAAACHHLGHLFLRRYGHAEPRSARVAGAR